MSLKKFLSYQVEVVQAGFVMARLYYSTAKSSLLLSVPLEGDPGQPSLANGSRLIRIRSVTIFLLSQQRAVNGERLGEWRVGNLHGWLS